MSNLTTLLPQERRVTIILAFLFVLRMLGLFMVLPVMAWYAKLLPGASPSLVGLSIGIYGLSQALLQIPFGRLSDKLGRKPVILLGLVILILGSVIAACSHTIWGLIIGRALQGAGAIGATILAFIADSTRETVRTRAMAVIGISIGGSFILSFILGPLIDASFGLSGIFWVTAILAIFAMGVSYFALPEKKVLQKGVQKAKNAVSIWQVLWQPDLLRLNLGIFVVHAVLTMSFLFLPLLIAEVTGWDKTALWRFYLPVLGAAFVLIAPFTRRADNHKVGKSLLCGAMLCLAFTQVFLGWFVPSLWGFVVLVVTFFSAFILLEAMLPAWVSRLAPPAYKGMAMGVFSTAQFLGIFVGGFLGGFCQEFGGRPALMTFSIVLMLLWVILVRRWQPLEVGKVIEIS